MGKAATCIRMLQILNTGRVYKVSELADLLETKPRNVIEYKKELDEVACECGFSFYIDTIPGRYGGYKLNDHAVLPSIKMVEEEKKALIEGADFLSKRNDFLNKKEFLEAMGKIISSMVTCKNPEDNLLIINRFPLVMAEQDLKHRFVEIRKAIVKKKQINIKYLSSKNIVKEHLFDPYELFVYNNAWFVIGWLNSLDHPGICWFKLNRIQDISTTKKSFRIWNGYKKSNYLDEFGFKTNGEWHHIEFVAHGTYASLVKERVYGKNQIVEPIDETSTKVSVDMQNEENIRVFILGFGKNITVLEPKWLKNDLFDIANHLQNLYNKTEK